MSKVVVKHLVYKTLQNSTTGLSVEDIWRQVSGGFTTIARALRKLREEGKAVATKIPGDRYGRKQWAASANVGKVSNRTTTNMNNPLQTQINFSSSNASTVLGSKPSLLAAIAEVIAKDLKQSFSAYDVTIKLREKVANDPSLVDTSEVGTVWLQGKRVPKITHEDVRIIVHELYNNGALRNFNRIFSGAYFKYEPMDITVANKSAQYDGTSTI